jgi:hypothetical protein
MIRTLILRAGWQTNLWITQASAFGPISERSTPQANQIFGRPAIYEQRERDNDTRTDQVCIADR